MHGCNDFAVSKSKMCLAVFNIELAQEDPTSPLRPADVNFGTENKQGGRKIT